MFVRLKQNNIPALQSKQKEKVEEKNEETVRNTIKLGVEGHEREVPDHVVQERKRNKESNDSANSAAHDDVLGQIASMVNFTEQSRQQPIARHRKQQSRLGKEGNQCYEG